MPRSKAVKPAPAGKKAKSLRRTAGARRTNSPPPFSADRAAFWFKGKALGHDWTSWHFPNWAKLLRRYRRTAARVVEIGSWEGRSALFFLNYMPRCRVTCIDTFQGGDEHQAAVEASESLPQLEERFDANVAAFANRVRKIKAHSSEALAMLGISGQRFDIAYIDGSHRAADVYRDGALIWPLMAPDGLIIFDDYQWKEMPGRLSKPKLGIDAFLAAFKGRYRLVHKAYQVAIVKR